MKLIRIEVLKLFGVYSFENFRYSFLGNANALRERSRPEVLLYQVRIRMTIEIFFLLQTGIHFF